MSDEQKPVKHPGNVQYLDEYDDWEYIDPQSPVVCKKCGATLVHEETEWRGGKLRETKECPECGEMAFTYTRVSPSFEKTVWYSEIDGEPE